MRRLLKDNRGQVRTLEAFFAVALMLGSLALIPTLQSSSHDSSETLTSTGRNILLSLDNDGTLAELICSGNWTELKSCVQGMLSPAVWFNITVFDENMTCINPMPLTSGSSVSDEIVAVDYVCASTSGNFAVYVIRLQLAAAVN